MNRRDFFGLVAGGAVGLPTFERPDAVVFELIVPVCRCGRHMMFQEPPKPMQLTRAICQPCNVTVDVHCYRAIEAVWR